MCRQHVVLAVLVACNHFLTTHFRGIDDFDQKKVMLRTKSQFACIHEFSFRFPSKSDKKIHSRYWLAMQIDNVEEKHCHFFGLG